MRKQVVTGIVTLLVALSPFTVMAQASGFDDQTRATVVALTQEVGHAVAPAVVSPGAGGETDQAPTGPQNTPSAPNPQQEGPATEPDATGADLPELNLTDLAEYTNQGVTIKAPADWTVDTDTDEGTPFKIDVPDTDLTISLTSDSSMDFPSWLGLALFRSRADVLVKQIGEDAQVEEASTQHTDQGLPMVKLAFSGTEDDKPMGGAIYILAPNESAYVLTSGGPSDQWQYAAPGLDLIAKSITFDTDLITSIQIGDQPEDYANDDNTVQVTVPAGWYAMSTGDEQFPVILAEPEVRYVVAVGTENSLGPDFDPNVLKQFVPESGELDPSKYSDLIHAIADSIGNSGGPIKLDEEASQVIPREGAVLVKLVGDAEIEQDTSIPVIIYVDLRTDSAAVAAVFGDTDSAKDSDTDMQALVASVQNLDGK